MGISAIGGLLAMSFIPIETTGTIELGFIKQESIRITDGNGRIQDKIAEMRLKRDDLRGQGDLVAITCDIMGLNPDEDNYGHVVGGVELASKQQKMPFVSPLGALYSYATSNEFMTLMKTVNQHDSKELKSLKEAFYNTGVKDPNDPRGGNLSILALPDGPEKEKKLYEFLGGKEFLNYFESRKLAGGGTPTGINYNNQQLENDVDKFTAELEQANTIDALRTQLGISAQGAPIPTGGTAANPNDLTDLDSVLAKKLAKKETLNPAEQDVIKAFLEKANPKRPASCTAYKTDVDSNKEFLQQLFASSRPIKTITEDLNAAKTKLTAARTAIAPCSINESVKNLMDYVKAYSEYRSKNADKTETDFEQYAQNDPGADPNLREIVAKAKTQGIANSEFASLRYTAEIMAENNAQQHLKEIGANLDPRNPQTNALFGNFVGMYRNNAYEGAKNSAIPFVNKPNGDIQNVCAKWIGTVNQIISRLQTGLSRGVMKLTRLQIREQSLEQQIKIASQARQQFKQMGQQQG